MKTNKIHRIMAFNMLIILGFFISFPSLVLAEGEPLLKSFSSGNAVGEIPIQSSVASSGAFVATVPINVIPGIAGMQPGLSLSYSSQAGNGIAGFGWNLSGISSISRRGLNYFQDGKTAPTVTSSTEPELTIDGKRLIYDSSETPSGTVYRRKYYVDGSNKTFIVYALMFSKSGGIYGFEVLFPNGQTGTYSAALSNHTWLISQLSDRHGNYITYNYSTVNGTPYISSISYGGNSKKSTAHFETISFTYETRFDKEKKYDAGIAFNSDQRLTKITNKLGTYTLNYSATSYYSLLSSIAFQSGASNLNPLTFSYGVGTLSAALKKETGNLNTYFTNANKDNINAMTGRYTEFSLKEGLVTYPKADAYKWGKTTAIPYECYQSMYNADDVVIITPEMGNTSVNSQAITAKLGEGFRGVVTLDIDGNPNTEEIVLINSNGSFYGTQSLRFTIYSSFLGKLGSRTKTYSFPSQYTYNGYFTVYPMNFLTGDFNGDGIQELCAIRPKFQAYDYTLANSEIYFFDLKSTGMGSDTYSCKETPFTIEPQDVVFAADYNGDGKTEVFCANSSGLYIYSLDQDGSSNPLSFTMTKIAETTAINKSHFDENAKNAIDPSSGLLYQAKQKVLLGDINGDGKVDILYAFCGLVAGSGTAPVSLGWKQLLSNGSGGFDVSTINGNWINTYNEIVMHDFNGDGRSDIVSIKDNSLQVWCSDGQSIASFKKSSYPLDGLAVDGKLTTIGVNNSNQNRVLAHIKNGNYTKLSVPNNEKINTLLTTVNNSLGVETKVKYARTDGVADFQSDLINVCQLNNSQIFPYTLFKGCLWVVGEANVTHSGTDYSKTSYRYTDPVVHLQGLGFCGFQQVTASDNITGEGRISNYNALEYGVLKSEITNKETIENKYNTSLNDKKEIKIQLKKQTRTDKATGVVTTSDFNYDAYNNVIGQTIEYGSDVTETISTDYVNTINSNISLIGQIRTTVKYRTRNSQTASFRTDYLYNSDYLPSVTYDYVNTNLTMANAFEYDQWSKPD